MLQDALLALSAPFTANTSSVISKEISELGARTPALSHHLKAKLPSRTPTEWHCIYLGRARAGAWTKTSQGQSASTVHYSKTPDSSTAMLLLSVLLGCAQICEPKGRPVLVENKTKPYLNTGQVWDTSTSLPLPQKQGLETHAPSASNVNTASERRA